MRHSRVLESQGFRLVRPADRRQVPPPWLQARAVVPMSLVPQQMEAAQGTSCSVPGAPTGDFSDELAVIHNGNIVAKSSPDDICNSSIIKEIFNIRIERMENDQFYYQFHK